MTPFRTLLLNLLVTLLLCSPGTAERVRIELKDGTVHRLNTGDEVIVTYYASGTETHKAGVLKDLFADTQVVLDIDGNETWIQLSDIISMEKGDASQLPPEFEPAPAPPAEPLAIADAIFANHPPLAMLPLLIDETSLAADNPETPRLPDRITFISLHTCEQDVRWADAVLKLTFTLNELEYQRGRLQTQKRALKDKAERRAELSDLEIRLDQIDQLIRHTRVALTKANTRLRSGLSILTAQDNSNGRILSIEITSRRLQQEAMNLDPGDICEVQYDTEDQTSYFSEPISSASDTPIDQQIHKALSNSSGSIDRHALLTVGHLTFTRTLVQDPASNPADPKFFYTVHSTATLLSELCSAIDLQIKNIHLPGDRHWPVEIRFEASPSSPSRVVLSDITKIHDAGPDSTTHVPKHELLDRETIAPPIGVSCSIIPHRNSDTNRDYLLLKPTLQGQVLRLLVNVRQKKSGRVLSKNILVEPAMEQYIEFKPRGARSPLASDYQVDIIAAERTTPVTLPATTP